ncbi:hypothetical protein SAMN05216223_116126 [Actinacidiphila yanglinensis]|uniref:MazG nucleotide pyrophosphohydrolase domain-containing protein n=1 Tax=Actinacidiphila yanglinensis TaxID=310779 RepID=A0A1H6DLX7_9ACTN|nr:MazG-like family protein [Actinacidiphila yanglinensis]SEG85726.1 hypothetical protein SAMN05216223_116126 [Actinacidiphila yanglinensis]
MNDSTWTTVDQLKQWLDDKDGVAPETARLMRILKLQEELGEVAEAVMGAMGTNPRKGASHTWDDVESEVCDVILSGMVLLATLTPDAGKKFDERLSIIAERSLA